jgi:predicted nucleotidyltransferase component of viral defense system
MIPPLHLQHWRTKVPWGPDPQVEQDLVLTRAVVQIFSDPLLREVFAFRGGTAMQKLFFDPPTRYSEDIDLVQVNKGAIGDAINALRKHLDPWLGEPQRQRKDSRFTLIYRFESEMTPVQKMRLKVEVNTGEHFTVLPAQRRAIRCESEWFGGAAEALTYELEELLGTKLRALFQRRKGRDLYDLAMALQHFPKLDRPQVIHCFQRYMEHGKTPVTRAQFEENLARKLADAAFLADVIPLLSPDAEPFEAKKAGERVGAEFLAALPGDPWKGRGETKPRRQARRAGKGS